MTLAKQLANFQAPEPLLDGTGEQSPPTAAMMAREEAAPGDAALLSAAVLYQADWKPMADGLGRHSREQVRALAASGLPVILRSISTSGGMLLDGDAGKEVFDECGHLARTSASEVPISIRQLILHNATFMKDVIAPPAARLSGFELEKRVYESTIVYTSLERDRVGPEIAAVLRRCAAVWVPCKANQRAIIESGIDEAKVFVVPYPYDPSVGASTVAAPRGSEVMVPDGLRFYSIGKWEPRKEQHRLIGAFLREFAPSERASLYLKTTEYGTGWQNYPSLDQSVRFWVQDGTVKKKGWTADSVNKRVRIDLRKLPNADARYTREQYEDPRFQHALSSVTRYAPPSTMLDIHRMNNIYVSASHGEAWELGAFDAKCAGNHLVYVGYGGPEDYAEPSDTRLSGTWEAPVHPSYGWEPDAKWQDYDINALGEALRAAKPPTRRVHPRRFYVNFGRTPIGELMYSILSKVCTKESWEKLQQAGGFG